MNDRTSSVHVRGVAAVRFASSASLSRALRNLKLHSDQPNVPPLSPQGLRWSSGRWFRPCRTPREGLILRRLLVAALQPAPRLDEDVAPLGGDAAHHRRAGRAGEHLDLLAEHSFGGAQAAQDDAASEALLAVHLAVGSAGRVGRVTPPGSASSTQLSHVSHVDHVPMPSSLMSHAGDAASAAGCFEGAALAAATPRGIRHPRRARSPPRARGASSEHARARDVPARTNPHAAPYAPSSRPDARSPSELASATARDVRTPRDVEPPDDAVVTLCGEERASVRGQQ